MTRHPSRCRCADCDPDDARDRARELADGFGPERRERARAMRERNDDLYAGLHERPEKWCY